MGRGSKGRNGKPARARTGRGKPPINRAKQSQRRTARAGKPLPSPRKAKHKPTSRTVNYNSGLSAEKQAELKEAFDDVLKEFEALDDRAELSSIYEAVGGIESSFTNLPAKLDDLRRRGFVHGGGLEERIEELDVEWDESVRPRVDKELKSIVADLDREVSQLEKKMSPSRLNNVVVTAARSGVERMEKSVDNAESKLRALYEGIEEGLWEVEKQVNHTEWMVTQLEESAEIELLEAEGPLMAVEAEWEEDGDDEGPDGNLYLTDQRLLFEQKEKIATKKFLFVTTKSELVQKLLIDVRVQDIETAGHSTEKRGFLGLRGDDILELVLAPTAEHARVRFHLKGQDAIDWSKMIKRIQSGDIDDDRAEEFVDEAAEAEAATQALPGQCPQCFSAVPPQPRGVTHVVCEFCGGTVTAE